MRSRREASKEPTVSTPERSGRDATKFSRPALADSARLLREATKPLSLRTGTDDKAWVDQTAADRDDNRIIED
jgi:hypothetical protein